MSVTLLFCLVVAAEPASTDDPVSVVKEAAAAYRAEDFAGAGALFMHAYDLTKRPAQLRNAAKAFQDGRLWSEALEAWRAFGALDDIAPADVAEANAQVALIEERRKADEAQRLAEVARAEAVAAKKAQAEAEARAAAAVRAPPPAPPPAPALVTEAPPNADPPYGAYITTGLGVAAIVGAGVMYLHANDRLGTLDGRLADKNGAGEIVGIDRNDAFAELDGINAERNAAAILAGVGIATAITGVVWWVLHDDEAPPGAVRF